MLKIRIQRFSRSLIRIFLLDVRNSKWRIQYGNEVVFEVVFEVADHDLDIKLLTFKAADAMRQLKILKSSSFSRNWSTGIFETANHDLAISLSKFKMAVKSSREEVIHKVHEVV